MPAFSLQFFQVFAQIPSIRADQRKLYNKHLDIAIRPGSQHSHVMHTPTYATYFKQQVHHICHMNGTSKWEHTKYPT